MKTLRLPILATLVLGSSAASASLVTIDANSYAAGTNVSNAAAGVTLSSMWTAGGPTSDPYEPVVFNFAPIYSVACAGSSYGCTTIAGSNVFGHDDHGIWDPRVFAYEGKAADYLEGEPHALTAAVEVFRADFADATNFVQLVVGGAHNNDYPLIDFWDTSGALIATCSTTDSGGYNPACTTVNLGDPSGVDPGFRQPWLISLTSSSYNIGFVTTGGWAGGQFVTQLTYNKVPEPGTLALMLVGALGIALRRRRQNAIA
jgi:hypothetical protein